MAGFDIGSDLLRNQSFAEIASRETPAEIGGRDILVDCFEQMNSGALLRTERERGQVRNCRSGSADDDPLRFPKKTVRLAPMGKTKKAVGPHEHVSPGARHQPTQRDKAIDGVVWLAVSLRSVQIGHSEARVKRAGQGHHRQALLKAGRCSIWFKWLPASGREEHGLDPKRIRGGARDGEVSSMRRVEASAKEGYTHRRVDGTGDDM